MRPPVISPQEWYDALPEIPDVVDVKSFFIYKGILNGLRNVVFYLSPPRTLHLARPSATGIWVFNYDEGVFEAASSSGAWGPQLIEITGRDWTSGSATTEDVSMSVVKYALSEP